MTMQKRISSPYALDVTDDELIRERREAALNE